MKGAFAFAYELPSASLRCAKHLSRQVLRQIW
jgi:hypothetical protein